MQQGRISPARGVRLSVWAAGVGGGGGGRAPQLAWPSEGAWGWVGMSCTMACWSANTTQ